MYKSSAIALSRPAVHPAKAKTACLAALAAIALAAAPRSDAAIAVIDVSAIAQLVNQVQMLQDQLLQAQLEFASITGSRGMEQLLNDLVRNYLPADWHELEDALRGLTAQSAIARQLRDLIEANAILDEEILADLPLALRDQVDAARRSVAMLQVLTREALETTSDRFEAIQELIEAIPSAEDQKGILDLQARIQAEQGMLQNESTKLDILFQTAQAEEGSRRQRAREQAIQDIGSLRQLPAMGL